MSQNLLFNASFMHQAALATDTNNNPNPTACNPIPANSLTNKIGVYVSTFTCSTTAAVNHLASAGAIAAIAIQDLAPDIVVSGVFIGDYPPPVFVAAMGSEGMSLYNSLNEKPNNPIFLSIGNPVLNGGYHTELYNPATGAWSSAGVTPVPLTHPQAVDIGPMVLRPDGSVFAVGGLYGYTAIYNSKMGSWSQGLTFPVDPIGGQLTSFDGPGALLRNGNVLVAVSPSFFAPPTHIFEFDGTHLIEQPTIPDAPIDASENLYMLVLPTGQILEMDFQTDVEIYTPTDNSYNSKWAPQITNAPSTVSPGKSYVIKGKQFNGMSQASMYGDDYQAATNYPLVRITNLKTGHVFYSRTHDHSNMGVATGNLIVSTKFDVPKDE